MLVCIYQYILTEREVVVTRVLAEVLDKGAGHLVRFLRDSGPLAAEGLAVRGDEVYVSKESAVTLRRGAIFWVGGTGERGDSSATMSHTNGRIHTKRGGEVDW